MGFWSLPPGSRQPSDPDERRRLSVFDLVGLAAGGMIGSGWLLGSIQADRKIGFASVWAWVIGGAVMLVITAVMVELGTAAPKTGGLIFLPLQSSGPLVATVVAAGLWIFYVLNAASEAAAMTVALSSADPKLVGPGSSGGVELTPRGLVCATAFLAVFAAVNLLAPRLFLRANRWLTGLKILVPILLVVLAFTFGFDAHKLNGYHIGAWKGLMTAFPAVVGGGILFAYAGFQGPLDFAGNIRQRGIGEAARLRWAVYGTVVGSIILYPAIQIAVLGHFTQGDLRRIEDPQAVAAIVAALGWAGWLLRINTVLSPLSSGLVFAHAVTREVAALSAAHLTHRGLQTARSTFITLRGRRYEVYWKVLLVDFVLGSAALVAMSGSWSTLTAMNGILMLVVYAIPGVVLVALRPYLPPCSRRRNVLREILPRAGFIAVALILYQADKGTPWCLALTVGCVLLLVLPLLAHWDLPVIGRILSKYDAREHVTLFREWRNPAPQAAMLLLGYLAVLTLLNFLHHDHGALSDWKIWMDWQAWMGFVAVGSVAAATFERLVGLSRRYMAENPPMLPAPATSPAG